MNGKELLEAMGHVEEQYIAEAEEVPKCRRHWQTAAISAACLALVLVGLKVVLPTPMEKDAATEAVAAGAARSMEEANSGDFLSPAPMMASALVQMTVRVVEQTPEALICIVIDPGTSSFQPDDQVKITLPDTAPQSTEETTAETVPTLYEVLYLPDESTDLIIPAQWTPLEDNP